jgi:hypothetical protein
MKRLLFAIPMMVLLAISPMSTLVEHTNAAQPTETPTPYPDVILWDTQIAIVWPHDGQGNPTDVAHSRAVNVSVWPRNQVYCTLHPNEGLGGVRDFYLGVARDNEPLEQLEDRGELILRTVNGVTFPSVEFNNVPADLAANPSSKYRFVLEAAWSNIWVHGADPRTIFPHPVVPTGYREWVSPEARIQIVWPHGEEGRFAPVEEATLVNVAIDIFHHGTLKSAPLDYEPDGLHISVAEGNDLPRRADPGPAQKVTYTANGQTFPRWVFNDVPVKPGQQYHFMASVFQGKISYPYTTIWTHAADARTFLPHPEVPPPCLE